jgi:hypothetical protein
MIAKIKVNSKLLGVLLIVLAVHLPLIFNNFHTDDFQVLEIVQKGFDCAGLKSMENPSNFRPLANFIIYLRYWLFDNAAGLWYILNILLHLTAVFLLFIYVKKLTDETTAVLAALFFGLYFQHFEAVLWLYGIIRLLTAVCVLLSLIYCQKFLSNPNRADMVFSLMFFFLGLFCAEDMVVICFYFLAVYILFIPKGEKRHFLLPGAGFMVLAAFYLMIRLAALGKPTLSTPYFYLGGHIWNNIFSYLGWLVFPSLDNPYILPFAKAHLPGLLPFLRPFDWLVFVLVTMAIIYIIRKGDLIQKQALLFTVIALIPAIFIKSKVSTKLVYIPSIGVAILVASFIKQGLSQAGQIGRKIISVFLAVYLICQSTAIILTIDYYRSTQKQVAFMLDEIDRLDIDWNQYEYMLFDNVPGRARLGNAFKYRHGITIRLIDRYEQAVNQPDITAEKQKLKAANKSYILIDFAGGHPAMVESQSRR